MPKSWKWLMAGGIALCMGVMSVPAVAVEEQVSIDSGTLRGTLADDVVSFLGVPYAASTAGEGRWRPPRPVEPWSGIRDAKEDGPICPQIPFFYKPNKPESEDCLTANIWSLASPSDHPRPVMVWIFEGGFVQGSGSSEIWNGNALAREGVVVVTFNYRVGRLGFFAHPALTRTAKPGEPLGNYTLLDQIALLGWVQRNIASFGGDPGNVTIFGESSGAVAVNELLVSPLARGLFAKAISESGIGRYEPKPIRGAEPLGGTTAEAVGVRFATGLGITGDGPEAASALRDAPFAKFCAPVRDILDPETPAPMIDGIVLPASPVTLFAEGRQAPVPLMVGGTSWEASTVAALQTDPSRVFTLMGTPAAEALEHYQGDYMTVAAELLSDQFIAEPARFEARAMQHIGVPAYLYRFSYVQTALRGKMPGAPHGYMSPFVFGTLPDRPGPFDTFIPGLRMPSAEDRQMEDRMRHAWVAFARTGDPGSVAGITWPRYRPADDVLLDFGMDGATVRRNFRRQNWDWLERRAEADDGSR